ncbi:hypothetical protein BH20ACI2_BH20ACI2_22700 [soil metagenome]
MKLNVFLLVSAFVLISTTSVLSQDDETRQGLGLPTMIGENARAGDRMNVSGRVSVEGAEKLKNPPVITVLVSVFGAVADRSIANSSGFYLIRNVPRGNVTIIVEVDGTEVIRKPIQSLPMGNPRFDFTIPWPPASAGISKPGVISAGAGYSRSPQNEPVYQKAIAAVRGNDSRGAVTLFNQLLAADPKDFVAWTELGTVYFRSGSLDNAEACYFKAIELKKDYFVALLNLGRLYFSKSQHDNAILVLSNAVKSDARSAEAHHLLGESYLQIKKGSAAVFHFGEALKIAPDEKADLHLRLASLYDAAKMKDKAAAEYKIFLQKKPEHPDKAALQKYISDNQK